MRHVSRNSEAIPQSRDPSCGIPRHLELFKTSRKAALEAISAEMKRF